MLTDPIADMLARVRNGYMVNKKTVIVPYSKIKAKIGKLLAEKKFIDKIKVIGEGKDKHLKVILRYENEEPAITSVQRVSKPGRRVYKAAQEFPQVLSGLGIAIVTTSKGIMTAKQARKANLGGEVICYVW